MKSRLFDDERRRRDEGQDTLICLPLCSIKKFTSSTYLLSCYSKESYILNTGTLFLRPSNDLSLKLSAWTKNEVILVYAIVYLLLRYICYHCSFSLSLSLDPDLALSLSVHFPGKAFIAPLFFFFPFLILSDSSLLHPSSLQAIIRSHKRKPISVCSFTLLQLVSAGQRLSQLPFQLLPPPSPA